MLIREYAPLCLTGTPAGAESLRLGGDRRRSPRCLPADRMARLPVASSRETRQWTRKARKKTRGQPVMGRPRITINREAGG